MDVGYGKKIIMQNFQNSVSRTVRWERFMRVEKNVTHNYYFMKSKSD